MDTKKEAEQIVALFDGKPAQMVSFLSGQLSVLKHQAQMLMGLCGLTITVTGFSGHHMVRAGPFSAGAMVVGICLILTAIVLTIRTLTKLRWVSQDLGEDLVATAHAVIQRRDHEQRARTRRSGKSRPGDLKVADQEPVQRRRRVPRRWQLKDDSIEEKQDDQQRRDGAEDLDVDQS